MDLWYHQKDTAFKISELNFDIVYRVQMHNQNEFDRYGQNDYRYQEPIDWTAFYHHQYGIVQISKNDGSILWELIP